MGVLDLPAPLYAWLDAALAGMLPPLARILVWGGLAGAASMALYALIAPQARIALRKREIAAARRALDAHEGELAEAGPMIGRLLKLSLGQVRMTTMPAVLASVPLLTVLAWMSTAYGHAYPPPGQPAAVEVRPNGYDAEWLVARAAGEAPGVLVRNGEGREVARVALSAPVPVIHERRWWNFLLGNPAGYLPAEAGVEEVHLQLPRQRHLSIGPGWARGWELSFFVALIASSLALKVGARIQ